MIGTFDYAAPEQLKEGPIDARTDVYALGGVLFQAITGKVPYPRETAAATMLAHLDSPPPSVLSVLPDASERLGEVVRRAMAKDPEDALPVGGRPRPRRARGGRGPLRRPATERSVATGDASPATHGAPAVPLPPALAVETGRGPFVGRAEHARAARGPLRRRRGRPAPVRAARGRARDRQDAAGDRARAARAPRGRDRALRPQRPRVARPLPAVHHRARSTTSRTARTCACRGDHARAERAGPLRPRAAPARRRAARLARRRRRDAPLPAVRGRHADARLRRPRAARWCCCSTTCTGPTRRRRCCSATCCRTPRRCGCSWSAPRATFESEVLTRLRRQPSFERIELSGLTAEETRALVARDDVTLAVRAPADRGDRRQPVLHRGDAAQRCPSSRSAR